MAITEGAVRDIALGKGGSYSLSRDVLKHTIWDTRYFGTAINDFTFFTQPIGAPWRAGNKTKNETNLLDSGKLPNGQTFLVKRIGVGLIVPIPSSNTNTPFVVQAFTNLMQSSVWQIRIAGREFDFECHGRQFLSAVMVSGANATNASYRSGDTIASGWISLNDTPIFIDQLVTFSVQMALSNPDATVDALLDTDSTTLNGLYATLQCSLEGTLTRAK